MSDLSIDKLKSANSEFFQTDLLSLSSTLIEISDQETLNKLTRQLNEISRKLREQSQRDELLDCKIENLKEQNKDIIDNRKLRNQYALYCFIFMCIWCVFVLSVVLLQGFVVGGFVLSDMVLSTLIGGTTISIIGLVGFIMKGLFPNDKKSGE